MGQRLPRKWGLGVFFLAAVLAIGVAAWSRPPDLLKISRLVFRPLTSDPNTYLWRSNDEVVLVRDINTITRYRLTTRTETSLSSASAWFAEEARAGIDDTELLEATLSPDAEWLEWKPRWGAAYLLSLSTSRHIRCEYNPGVEAHQFAWFADGHRYAVFGFSPQGSGDPALGGENMEIASDVCIGDTRAPRSKLTLQVETPEPIDSHRVVAYGAAGDQIHVVVANDPAAPTKSPASLTLYTWSFGVKGRLSKDGVIVEAPHAVIPEAAISKDGRQIAWIEEAFITPSLLRMLHRWIPRVNAAPYTVTSLWTSRIDGSNRREIGERTSFAPDSTGEFAALRWRDDREITFLYQGAVYAVEAGAH